MAVSIPGINHDNEFIHLYIQMGLDTKSKEILHSIAFNFPGFVYILRAQHWHLLQELYY